MLLDSVLVMVLIICFITDIKYQKIYNKVIFPCLIGAFIFHFIYSGFRGLTFSLAGFGTGMLILLVPYLLGGMGAGDVKLLALIGAIKGSIFVLNTALYMAVIGGVVAIFIIVWNRGFFDLMKAFYIWIASHLCGVNSKLQVPSGTLLKKYPYGTAIAAGAMICLIFKGAWLI